MLLRLLKSLRKQTTPEIDVYCVQTNPNVPPDVAVFKVTHKKEDDLRNPPSRIATVTFSYHLGE